MINLLTSVRLMNLIYSNKPILTFSVPYNTNTTHIGSILRKYWHLIDQDPSLKLLWPERPNPLWFPTNATITLRIAKCIPSSQIINTNEINSRTNTTSDSGFDMMRYVYWSFVIGRGNSGYFGHVFTTETSRFEREGVKRGNGTERTGGTGMAEPEKRKRKEGKTRKRG